MKFAKRLVEIMQGTYNNNNKLIHHSPRTYTLVQLIKDNRSTQLMLDHNRLIHILDGAVQSDT
jgi:hypothetical protein